MPRYLLLDPCNDALIFHYLSQRFLNRIDNLVLGLTEIRGIEGIGFDIKGGELVLIAFGQRFMVGVEDILDESEEEDDAQ